MTRIPTLLCLCLLGGPLLAQTTSWIPKVPDDDPKWRNPVTGERPPWARGERSDEGRTSPMVTNEVMALAATQPTRIPPGGEGTMIITLMLKGNVVISPDTGINLSYQLEQKGLSLGDYTVRPPKHMGEGPLAGQSVYDESVILELPVRVAAGAALGQHLAVFVAEFELKDTTHGISKGRWVRGVKAEVRVAKALPSMARRAPERVLDASASDPTESGSGGGFRTPRPGGESVFGTVAPELADDGVPMGPPGLPGASLQTPLVLWVFLGCGALALAGLVVLLLSKLVRPRGAA